MRKQWGVTVLSDPLMAPVLPGKCCTGLCLGHLQRIRLWRVDSCCLRSVWARQGYRKGEDRNGRSGLVSCLASRCPDFTPAGSTTPGDSKHNHQPLLSSNIADGEKAWMNSGSIYSLQPVPFFFSGAQKENLVSIQLYKNRL